MRFRWYTFIISVKKRTIIITSIWSFLSIKIVIVNNVARFLLLWNIYEGFLSRSRLSERAHISENYSTHHISFAPSKVSFHKKSLQLVYMQFRKEIVYKFLGISLYHKEIFKFEFSCNVLLYFIPSFKRISFLTM